MPSASDAPAWRIPQSSHRCPCQSGESYGECCGRLHSGALGDVTAHAPTAEKLMRSRYSAFIVGDASYLLKSWHPSTRPRRLELDPAQRWFGLEILRTAGGGMLQTEGIVEFRARYQLNGEVGQQHETSRFVRTDGHWVYLDAV